MTSKPDVVHLVPHLHFGVGRVVCTLAEKYSEIGRVLVVHSPRVATLRNEQVLLERLRDRGVVCHQADLFSRDYMAIAKSALDLVPVVGNPARLILHSHSGVAALVGLLLAEALPKSLVRHVNTYHGWGLVRPPWMDVWDLFSLRQMNRVICVSRKVREQLAAGGIRRVRMCTIYNGVSPPDEADSHLLPANQPTRWWAKGGVRLLAAGQLIHRKGFDTLLKAMQQIAVGVRTRVRLLVVGSGPVRAELIDLIKTGSLTDCVCMAPQVRSLDPWLPLADIIIVPSRADALPGLVLEAMAHSKPVIATRVGGIPEIVQHERTGLLVPAEDPRSLAEAVASLALSEARRRTMGEQGRQRVRRRFSLEVMWKRYWQEYTRL